LEAGLSATTLATMAPFGSARPMLAAIYGVTLWICTPSQPRVTWPCARI
jgi:hypothetical protein